MNRWNAWRSSLGLASLCFAIVGCGGGDIPDPDSDPNAVTELPGASAPAPAEAPAPAVAEAAAPADAAVAPTAAPTPPAAEAAPAEATAAPTAPAEAEAAAEPSKAKNSAATAEMLALGNKPLPAEATAPATAATTNPADPAAAMAAGMAAAPGPPGATSEAAAGLAGAPPADPGVAAPGSEMPGYPGAGDGGDAGGENGPANFRSPVGAVNAFLKALKAKSSEQLAEATARRAPREASGPKNQKLFQSILDYSLSEDDLSDLANKLEGFTIVGNNVPKSTGKFTLILGKAGKNGEYYRRTITTRHEKDGWKVSDISGVGKVEKPIMLRRGVRRR